MHGMRNRTYCRYRSFLFSLVVSDRKIVVYDNSLDHTLRSSIIAVTILNT